MGDWGTGRGGEKVDRGIGLWFWIILVEMM